MIKEIYKNQDLKNPQYVFHGSKELINGVVEARQARCISGKAENLHKAIYATSFFDMAVAYSIAKNIEYKKYFNEQEKRYIETYNWGIDVSDKNFVVNINKGHLSENSVGYVYVFNASDFTPAGEKNYQYVCYNDILPIDIIKTEYKDVVKYFNFKNESISFEK